MAFVVGSSCFVKTSPVVVSLPMRPRRSAQGLIRLSVIRKPLGKFYFVAGTMIIAKLARSTTNGLKSRLFSMAMQSIPI